MKKFYNILLISIIGIAVAIAVMAFNNPPPGGPPIGNGAISVDATGNVGIGKTPVYKLDVNGIVNSTGLYVNGSPYLGSQWTTSGSNIYYNVSGGNVGIGTTAPNIGGYSGKVLTIADSNPPVIEFNRASASAQSIVGTFRAGNTSNSVLAGLDFRSGSANNTGAIDLMVNNGSSIATAVRIIENGNVGIGTVSPGTKLDVSGTARMTGFQLGTSATDGYVLTANSFGVGTWLAPSGGVTGSGTTNYLSKFTAATVLGNSLVFDNGTNVGIGTASPDAKLDIVGGNLDLNNNDIVGVNKITANSIDPVFKINDQQYVTYAPDSIGQKVELVGQGQLVNGEWSIDLSRQKENSDLWLFYQIVKPETIIPFVSSQSSASLYAYITGSNLMVKLKDGDPQARFSYRLIASRIDQKTDYLLPETKSDVYIDVDSLKK